MEHLTFLVHRVSSIDQYRIDQQPVRIEAEQREEREGRDEKEVRGIRRRVQIELRWMMVDNEDDDFGDRYDVYNYTLKYRITYLK